MAGNPFADYLWMGDMDKFDQEIEAEIEKEFHEEEFIRSCIEQLLEEEEEQTVYYDNKGVNSGIQEVPKVTNNFNALTQGMESLYVSHQSPHHQFVNGTNAPITDYKYVNGYSNSQPISNNAGFINGSTPTSNGAVKSNLNPNATPFKMNPDAEEFVPRFSQPVRLPQYQQQFAMQPVPPLMQLNQDAVVFHPSHYPGPQTVTPNS